MSAERRSVYYIACDLCATGNLDFVYSKKLSADDLREVLFAIKNYLNAPLKLNKVGETSKLFCLIEQLLETKKFGGYSICVDIPLPCSYEDWYQSLGKSERQNIRTAYNRMERENLSYTFEVFCKNKVRKTLQSDIMALYNKRQAERCGKISCCEKIIRNLFNPITLACKQGTNNFVAVLKINGKTAAFLSGLTDVSDDRVIVPRLAINSEFKVFCPGSLLVAETIKYALANTIIRHLDLSRGEEKYKFVLGGEAYRNIEILL